MYISVLGRYYFTQEKLNTSMKKTKEPAKLLVGRTGNKECAAASNSSTDRAAWWVGWRTDRQTARVKWILVCLLYGVCIYIRRPHFRCFKLWLILASWYIVLMLSWHLGLEWAQPIRALLGLQRPSSAHRCVLFQLRGNLSLSHLPPAFTCTDPTETYNSKQNKSLKDVL